MDIYVFRRKNRTIIYIHHFGIFLEGSYSPIPLQYTNTKLMKKWYIYFLWCFKIRKIVLDTLSYQHDNTNDNTPLQ